MMHLGRGGQDQEVLHHARVFMRKNVAMEDGLSGPFLETHADDRGCFLGNPDGVLNEPVRRRDAGDRDYLEVVHVDVEWMSLSAPAGSVRNFDRPLLTRIQEDCGGNGE